MNRRTLLIIGVGLLAVLLLGPGIARRVLWDPSAPATVSGRVLAPTGAGIRGALVEERSGSHRSVLTGWRGSFRMTYSTPTAGLRVSHPDYATTRVDFGRVTPGTHLDVDVILLPGVEAQGTVVDPTGAPVQGALVEVDEQQWLTPAGRTGFGGDDLLPKVESRSDGSFLLTGLHEGDVWLTARYEGFAPASVGPVAVPRRDGEGQDALRIVLRPGVALRGHVRSETGEPIAGATVQTHLLVTHQDVTGADGAFELTGLPSVPSKLYAYAPGFASTPIDLTAEPGDLTIMMSSGVSIQGRVVDAATHLPIRTFEVWNDSFDDADGRFALSGLLPSYGDVEVAAPGYASAFISVERFVVGQTVDVGPIELDRGGTIRGRVVDPDGRPRAGIPVQLCRCFPKGWRSSPRWPAAATALDGTFELTVVPTGVAPTGTWCLAVLDEPVRRNVVMPPGGSLDGIVLVLLEGWDRH